MKIPSSVDEEVGRSGGQTIQNDALFSVLCCRLQMPNEQINVHYLT